MLELGRIAQPIRSLNERILSIFVVDPSSGRTLGYVVGLPAIAVSLVAALDGTGLTEEATPTGTLDFYLIKPLVGVGFALAVAGISLGTSWLKAVFSFTPLRLIGIVSFSIYLWHVPIIRSFIDYPEITSKPTNAYFWTLIGATAVAVFALACFMYLAVERPFMRYARRSVRRSAPVSAATELVDVATLPTAKMPAVAGRMATRFADGV